MFRCFFDIIDSTNTQAKRIINDSSVLPDAFSLIALNQTQARGKLGASWKSSLGNLHLSIVIDLKKHLDDIKNIGLISILSSLAVRETLRYFVEVESLEGAEPLRDRAKTTPQDMSKQDMPKQMVSKQIMSKWPNDIIIKTGENTAKIAGILLELEQNQQGENYLIIGIGVNLAVAPELSNYKTTSLFDIISRKVDALEFATKLENTFFELLLELQQNKQSILDKFRESLFLFKQQIQIKLGNDVKSGVFEDISQEGYLILRETLGKDLEKKLGENSKQTIITAGDIFGF